MLVLRLVLLKWVLSTNLSWSPRCGFQKMISATAQVLPLQLTRAVSGLEDSKLTLLLFHCLDASAAAEIVTIVYKTFALYGQYILGCMVLDKFCSAVNPSIPSKSYAYEKRLAKITGLISVPLYLGGKRGQRIRCSFRNSRKSVLRLFTPVRDKTGLCNAWWETWLSWL